MSDDRIATDDTTCLSAILPKNRALSWFKYFSEQIGMSIYTDETGIFYYEKKFVPYYYIKNNLSTLSDTTNWTHDDWKKYFSL